MLTRHDSAVVVGPSLVGSWIVGPFVDPAKFECAKRAENMDREAETEILTGFAQSAIKTGRTSFFYNVRAPNLKHRKIASPFFMGYQTRVRYKCGWFRVWNGIETFESISKVWNNYWLTVKLKIIGCIHAQSLIQGVPSLTTSGDKVY